jgi:PAS domain S-box-containing protein
MTDGTSRSELAAELEDLRARLAEAEEALRAIRNGEVDAVVVTGKHGEQVYTLTGADSVYRQLIETMSEGAVTLSPDGVVLYCNVCFARTLGRPLEQVLGTALRNYLSPADQQALDDILVQARTGPSRREISLKSSEGRVVPVYLSASRLHSEAAQMVFCLVLTDLTEQKRHEQIVAAERLARLILEQAAGAIVVCDEQGQVSRASHPAQSFCDGSPLLRPFAEVFPLRTGASDPFHLASVLQGETLRNVEVALDRQGQKLHLILNAGPLLNGQQILGCVVTLTDITERKRAQAALAAAHSELERRVAERTAELTVSNQELESFAYAVSHDLRAPLRGIDGWSQAVLEDCGPQLDDRGRKYLKMVRSETHRMDQLIDDLLELSRVTRAPMKRGTVDLTAMAGELEASLRAGQPERVVDFVVAPGMVVQGDAVLLRAVLQNLLGNAWKFTEKRPRARIEVGCTSEQGRTVYHVRDDGAGFDMRFAGKLFGPFQRLHSLEEFPGTGIGLATVQRIIHRHGGKVWATAEVDQGATFYFSLTA